MSAVVGAVPAGEVVTYGEVAREAGYPRQARAVGNLLAADSGGLPWWRVVTATGRLVPGAEADHARRLCAEGVVLRDPTHVHMTPAPSRSSSAGGSMRTT